MCEASAILHLPCSKAADGCWLVADNEVRDRLFLYPVGASGEPEVASRRALDIRPLLAPKDELSDMEALARLSSGEVLVYGSHSRNRDCKVRGKRRRYLGLRVEENGAIAPGQVGFVRGGKQLDWSQVFEPDPAAGATLARLRAVVLRAEELADAGDCRNSFDLEGAAAIPGEDGDAVWLGLRAPTIDGNAVLVRHDIRAGRLRLVEARLVATRGGIRGLARRGRWLYGLSDASGEDAAFHLWRFDTERLADDEQTPIEPEEVARVDSRSEGLDWIGARAVVVQDGEEGTPRCVRDATWQQVPSTHE